MPRIGRIKVSSGLDAVDGASSTIYGGATLSYFQVWASQVARGTVGVGDPLDFSLRLDNRHEIQTEPVAISACGDKPTPVRATTLASFDSLRR